MRAGSIFQIDVFHIFSFIYKSKKPLTILSFIIFLCFSDEVDDYGYLFALLNLVGEI